MHAIIYTVLAGIFSTYNTIDAINENNIDRALESVETVLRFHKHDPSSDLAIINKVQKVLDRIKSASKYADDIFTPNQYRLNPTESEVRPMAIHWEDKLFSYEITRNKKKRKKSLYANRERTDQEVKQITDGEDYLETVASESNDNILLRTALNIGKKTGGSSQTNIINKAIDNYSSETGDDRLEEYIIQPENNYEQEVQRNTSTYSQTETVNKMVGNYSPETGHKGREKYIIQPENNSKQEAEEQYELKNKESLPELAYTLESELTASSSIESDKASGLENQPSIVSSGQVAQNVNFRSKISNDGIKTPERLLSENSNQIKEVEIKVGVMHKHAEKNKIQAKNKGTVIGHRMVSTNPPRRNPKRIHTLKSNAFNYKFKSGESYENFTNTRANLMNLYESNDLDSLIKSTLQLESNKRGKLITSTRLNNIYKDNSKITTKGPTLTKSSTEMIESKIGNARQIEPFITNIEDGIKLGKTFESATINNNKNVHDFDMANNSKFIYKYFMNQKSNTKTQKSKDPIVERSSMTDVKPPRKIPKKSNVDDFNDLFQSDKRDENLTSHFNLKQLDSYNLKHNNFEIFFNLKSGLENSGENLKKGRNLHFPFYLNNAWISYKENDSATNKVDNPTLTRTSSEVTENKATHAAQNEPFLALVEKESTKGDEVKVNLVNKEDKHFNMTNDRDFTFKYLTHQKSTEKTKKFKDSILREGYAIEPELINKQTDKKITKFNGSKSNSNVDSIPSLSKIEAYDANTLNGLEKFTSITFKLEKDEHFTNINGNNENNTNIQFYNREMTVSSLFDTDTAQSSSTPDETITHNVHDKRTPKYIIFGATTEKNKSNISKTILQKPLFRTRDTKGDEFANTEVNKTYEAHPFNVANDWDFAYDDFIHERRRKSVKLK